MWGCWESGDARPAEDLELVLELAFPVAVEPSLPGHSGQIVSLLSFFFKELLL